MIATSLRFGDFLRSARRRIDPLANRLGPFERLSSRRGRPVSQQELAEAIEVSRNWYTLLESGGAIRTSPRLLVRIAEVLMLSEDERTQLFRLAMPELRSTKVEHSSYELLVAFRSLRWLGQKLWTATSETEAMALIREYAATHFACDVVMTHEESGNSAYRRVRVGAPQAVKRMEKFDSLVRASYDSTRLLEVHNEIFVIPSPGDVLTRSDQDFPEREFLEKTGYAMDAVGWDMDFMVARVRSRLGFAAHISVIHEARRVYPEVERQHLSTIAHLASHALSGTRN